MKLMKVLSLLGSLACLVMVISCSSDDGVGSDDDNDKVPYVLGTFLDSPVEGLYFTSKDTVGYTDESGTFAFRVGEEIEFLIGQLSLGVLDPKETITPLDFGGVDATINSDIVKNLAALIQSLDDDCEPENGIEITREVSDEFEANAIDLNSDDFVNELSELIISLNTDLGINLKFVHPNDAAKHLASTLQLEDDLVFAPTVKQGRRWEDGIYFQYNTELFEDPDAEYNFDINGDSVVYHFGGGTGYIFEKVYSGDTLYGFGNIYEEINTNPEPSNVYQSRDRISTPGYVVDHQDSTFIGYFNFRKVQGNSGEITGTYKAFLFFEAEFNEGFGGLSRIDALHSDLEISGLDENDSLTFTTTNYLEDPAEIESFKLHKSVIENEEIFLVLLDGSEYIFANRKSELYPGLISYKVQD